MQLKRNSSLALCICAQAGGIGPSWHKMHHIQIGKYLELYV